MPKIKSLVEPSSLLRWLCLLDAQKQIMNNREKKAVKKRNKGMGARSSRLAQRYSIKWLMEMARVQSFWKQYFPWSSKVMSGRPLGRWSLQLLSSLINFNSKSVWIAGSPKSNQKFITLCWDETVWRGRGRREGERRELTKRKREWRRLREGWSRVTAAKV